MKKYKLTKTFAVAVLATVFSVLSTLSYANDCPEGQRMVSEKCIPCAVGDICPQKN